jgi:ribosomal protein L16/L10AE
MAFVRLRLASFPSAVVIMITMTVRMGMGMGVTVSLAGMIARTITRTIAISFAAMRAMSV